MGIDMGICSPPPLHWHGSMIGFVWAIFLEHFNSWHSKVVSVALERVGGSGVVDVMLYVNLGNYKLWDFRFHHLDW